MATRTVFLRFGSNVSTFASDMQRAAAATREVQVAGERLSAAKAEEAVAYRELNKVRTEGEAKIAALQAEQLAKLQALATMEATAAEAAKAADAAKATAAAEAAAATEAEAAALAGLVTAQEAAAARQVAVTAEAAAAQTAAYEVQTKAWVANSVEMSTAATVAAQEGEAAFTLAEAEKQAAVERTSAAVAAAAAKQEAAQAKQSAASSRASSNLSRNAMLGGLVGAAGIYETTKLAMQFQTEMTQAAAVSDITRNHLKLMSDEVLSLSTRMPISAHEFADALVVAEQAGFQGYQALSLMRTAGEGAMIGMTDTKTATEDVARVLNGYGLSVSHASEVNNLLVASVRHGIGSYHEFGDALAQMAPLAKSAHVPLSEMAGALAAMSTKSQDAGASGMALIRTVFGMTKVGSDAETVLVNLAKAHGVANVATGQGVIETLGLVGTMRLLGQATGGELEQIERISPSVRSAKGALALLADGGSEVARVAALMTDSEKLAQEEAVAWAEQQGTAANQMKIAENQIHATAITIGQDFVPIVRDAMKILGGMAAGFADLPEPLQKGVVGLVALASGSALVFGLMSKMGPLIKGVTTALSAQTVVAQGAADAELELAGAEEVANAASGWLAVAAVGITLLAGAFGLYNAGASDAKQTTQDFTDALNQEQSGVAGATATLIEHNLAQDHLFETMNKFGVTSADMTAAIQRGVDDQGALNQSTDTFTQKLGLTDDALKAHGATSKQISDVHQDLKAAMNGSEEGANDLTADLRSLTDSGALDRDEMQKAEDVLVSIAKQRKGYTDSIKGQTESQKALDKATQDNMHSLLSTGNFAANASDDMRKLTDSEKDLQSTMHKFLDIGSALSDATAKAKENMTVMADGVGVFKDTLKDAQKDVDAQAQAMYDAYQAQQDAAVQGAKENATDVSRAAADAKTIYGASTSAANTSKMASAGVTLGLRDTTRAAQDQATAVKESAKQNKKSLQDFKDELTGGNSPTVAMDVYVGRLAKAAEEQKKFNANLDLIRKAGGSDDLISQLRKLGAEGAPTVQQFADVAAPAIDEVSGKLKTDIPDAIKSANESMTTLTPNAEASFGDFESAMEKQVKDASDFLMNVSKLHAEGYGGLADEFVKAGPKAAHALADAVAQGKNSVMDSANANAAQYVEMFDADGSFSKSMKAKFDMLDEMAKEEGTKVGSSTVESIANALASEGISHEQAMKFFMNMEDTLIAVNPEWGKALIASLHPQADKDYHDPGGGTGYRNADGNILRFASGGENHIAQFAKGGDWRVWAEPETGGEAYIPLAGAKRGRSTDILGSVADMFGYDLQPKGTRPAGSSMIGGGGVGGDTRVVYVTVQQPVSKQTKYEFNGPIHGYSLEKVTADAERKKRHAALGQGST